MSSKQLSRKQTQRSIDTSRSTARDAADAVHELADALEAGEADPADVANTFAKIAAAAGAIEDAAEDAGAIEDAYAPKWQAINESRKALYHTAKAVSSERDGVIAPTPDRSREDAVEDLEAAIEHTEAAGGAE